MIFYCTHNKMSVMEALRRLHQSKSICCPSCKHILIIDEKNIQISGDTNIISILHKVCREANPKKLHVCTQCGSRSNYSRNKLIKYYCKCTNKDNETPSANSAHSMSRWDRDREGGSDSSEVEVK